MADAFSNSDTKALLKAKHILFVGDSNIRAQYKDLIWLLNHNTLIEHAKLRSKLESSYQGDILVSRSKLHHGRDFQEVRKYTDSKCQTRVEFLFITRCYNKHLEKLFTAFHNKSKPVPDVIVINSCLWDLARWGPNGVPEYKDNMVKLMRLMKQSLPKECLVIWTTALPMAAHVRGGLLIKQIEFMEPLLRFEVMEANTFARQVVISHGFDLLDNHYHTRMQMHRRAKDGVHYMPIPVRLMTNLLLTHVALSWGRDLPRNISSVALDKAIAQDSLPAQNVMETTVKMPTGGIFSRINLTSPVVQRTRGLKITFKPNEEKARKCKLFQEELPDYQVPRPLQPLMGYPKPQPGFPMPQPGYPMLQPRYDMAQQERQIYYPNYQNQPPAEGNFRGPVRRRYKKKNNNRKNPYSNNNNQYTYRY